MNQFSSKCLEYKNVNFTNVSLDGTSLNVASLSENKHLIKSYSRKIISQ